MNVNLLKSVIALKGKTIKELAKGLGLSKSGMYRKMHGQSEFTRAEIQKLIEILEIDFNTAMEIFFTEKVSFKTQKEDNRWIRV